MRINLKGQIEKNQGKVEFWVDMAGSTELATSSSSSSRREEDARDRLRRRL